MDEISVTALMPMKAHSERLPNKNIKIFHGKPLYQVVLDTLIKSRYIKAIIINTDIESILGLTDINQKVNIIERPEELRGDFVPFMDIIEYDMNQTDASLFLQTHATNPILKTSTIDESIETFSKSIESDSLFGVTRHDKRMYSGDKLPLNHDPHDKLLRTQDLEPIYSENSCIYIFSRESFRNAGNHRIGHTPYFFEVNEIESIDIDYEKEFLFAEIISKTLQG
jgi:CMP-N-acetylneuraminic acid synthetase